jgi:hypothetical protein
VPASEKRTPSHGGSPLTNWNTWNFWLAGAASGAEGRVQLAATRRGACPRPSRPPHRNGATAAKSLIAGPRRQCLVTRTGSRVRSGPWSQDSLAHYAPRETGPSYRPYFAGNAFKFTVHGTLSPGDWGDVRCRCALRPAARGGRSRTPHPGPRFASREKAGEAALATWRRCCVPGECVSSTAPPGGSSRASSSATLRHGMSMHASSPSCPQSLPAPNEPAGQPFSARPHARLLFQRRGVACRAGKATV